MDRERIENIFKEWLGKSLLTRKGALRVEPVFVRHLRMILVWVSLGLLCFLSGLLFSMGFSFEEEDQFLPLICLPLSLFPIPICVIYVVVLGKSCFDFFFCLEPAIYALVEPILCPFLKTNPILLFYKDHLVASSGWIGYKKTYRYSDLETVKCLFSKEKGFYVHLLFKGMDKPFEVERKPVVNRVLHLFGSAFDPIFINEPLCEDMLRLYADMITLGRNPQNQQAGLQCAVKYFAKPKYKDYDYTRRLPELVELFNQYRAQNRMPKGEDYINRCLSILQNKGVDYDGRLALLSHLFECAYASEEMVDVVELDRLSRIAYYFRIKEWDFISLKYGSESKKRREEQQKHTENAKNTKQQERYQSVCSSRQREAYNLLGLKPGATLEEVKGAYRTQVKSCHPDTLPPNATDNAREEATVRFRMVKEAYDFLCAELAVELVNVAK